MAPLGVVLDVETNKTNEIGKPTTRPTTLYAITIGFLILIAFLIRLYKIDSQSFWWDETLSFHRASRDIAYILSNKITMFDSVTTDQHPPLYFLLLHFALVAFGNTEFALRFLSMSCTVLTVPLSFQVGQQIWNKQTGLFSALVAAISPFYLWYGQEARPYALVAMLTTLSTYLFLRLTRNRSVYFLVGYLLVTAALMAAHYLTTALVFAQFVYLVIYASRTRGTRRTITIVALCTLGFAFAVAAPFAISTFMIKSGAPLAVPVESVIRDIIVTFTFGVTVDQFKVLPFAAAFAVVAAGTTVLGMRKQTRRSIAMLWICITIPLAVIYLISLYKSVYGTRYVIFLAPTYYIMLGYGIAQLYRRHPALGIAFTSCLIAAAAYGSFDYLIVNNNDKQDYRDTVRYITQHARKDDAIILDDKRIVTAFEYYYKGTSPLFGIPGAWTTDKNLISRQISQIASQHSHIWLVLSMQGDIDPNDLVEKTLKEGYAQLDKHVVTGSTYSIDTYLYSARPYTVNELPSDAIKTDINFADQLTLLGYTIKAQNEEMNHFDVVLYWKTQTASLPKLASFGQLIDSKGNAWGFFDGEPFKGVFPTDQWKAGSIIADQRELQITPGAPQGTYSLRVGVRLAESGNNRLRIREKNGHTGNEVVELGNAIKLDRGAGGDIKEAKLPKYIDASFDNQITLLASDFTPRSTYPGEDLSFRLFWRNGRADGENLDVGFWLRDDKGKSVRIESEPISTVHPRDSWAPGELVGAYYNPTIPATMESGTYNLYVTLNRQDTYSTIPARFGLNPFSIDSVQLGEVTVLTPDRQYSLPPSLVSVTANIDEKVELLGFDYEHMDGVTTSRGRGSPTTIDVDGASANPFSVTLWWKALSEMAANYSITVQVLDSNGRLVDQHDGYPAEAARPTAGWVAGEVIRDTHPLKKLTKLPPGSYTLIVAVYNSDTGERLKTRDRTLDYVKIADVVIH